jgi:hypothetical protein
MSKRRTLAQQWDDFELLVGIYKTSAIQRSEMRRAFYAGAASIIDAMMVGLEPGTEPTDTDLQYITDLTDEMRQFGRDIAAGKA